MVALLFLLFGAFSAFVEAVLYARRGAEAFAFNEHAVMTLQRAAVVLLGPAALLLLHWTDSAWYVACEAVPALLLFPLVHDEAYNFTRLWIDYKANPLVPDNDAFGMARLKYTYGYQSPTTTARFDFTGRQRTWLAILGLAAWVLAAYIFL
ncbi:MAG TPA: hypothetical protein VF598_10685 [Hymenobacter sp.]|jgi:hypothetical protein